MSNIVTSLGSNVKFPVVASLPDTLEEGTFCIYNDAVYVGDADDLPVLAGGASSSDLEFVVKITQVTTGTPNLSVKKNNTGLTFSISRVGVGQYTLTASGAFFTDDVILLANNLATYPGSINLVSVGFRASGTSAGGLTLDIYTRDTSDNSAVELSSANYFGDLTIIARIYN